jgi:hypothetical protein
VVTSLEFDLHPLGPEVATALVLYSYDDAASVLQRWRDTAREAPATLVPEIGLWSIPPVPDVPERLHGAPVLTVAGVYIGPPGDAGTVLAPLRQLGTPLADLSSTASYVESQRSLDALFPEGGRYYWKSHFVDQLTDELIDTLLEHDAHRPSPESLIMIRTLGGAIARVGGEETAYPHRSANFNISVDASWHDPQLDQTAIGWARSTWDALTPFATGGLYINFAGLGDDQHLRSAALGGNEGRLDEIRRTYDPDGLFDAAAHRP